MKKKTLLIALSVFLLTGCASGGVPQEQYESVVAERDELKEQLAAISNAEEDSEDNNLSNEENQNINLSSSDLIEQISIEEYSYTDSIDTTWYFMEITNNSPVTVKVETNVIAKDTDGNTIGASSGSEEAIESGYTVCISHMFDEAKPATYEYTISAHEEEYHSPVLSDLQYEVSDTGDKLIISCTNNGEDPAEFVEGLVLFFKGDQLLGQSSNYFTDDDSELKPGNTLAKEFEVYSDEQYDNYKVYLTGRR